MIYIVKIISICLIIINTTSSVNAMVVFEEINSDSTPEINIAGFVDYPPFGSSNKPKRNEYQKFTTVFQPIFDDLAKTNKIDIKYKNHYKDYSNTINDVKSGDIDILAGAYYDTKKYVDLDLVYPSILSNPITIFMLPENVSKIKTKEDMKKYKGIRSSKEYYTDFALEELESYNIETVNTGYEMFEKLFTKKVDYILAGQYFGIMEASKLGLRNYVVASKQTLWKMPMFIGISKMSKHRKKLMNRITQYSKDPKNKEIIKNNLIQMIRDFEILNSGIVPPTFKEEQDS